jgi:hypothetical protein
MANLLKGRGAKPRAYRHMVMAAGPPGAGGDGCIVSQESHNHDQGVGFMDELELKRVLKEFKTLRQLLNPSNVQSYVKWSLDIIPVVTQKAIDAVAENKALRKEIESLRQKAQSRGSL